MGLSEDEKSSEIHADSETNSTENSIFDLRTTYGIFSFAIISLLISILIQFLPDDYGQSFIRFHLQGTKFNLSNQNLSTSCLPTEQRMYAIYGRSSSESHLLHVKNILQRMGYRRVSVEGNWDLLWAHDYPFRTLREKIHNLGEFQKVNHIPGSGFITNKVDLSTTDLPFIPKAFKLPKDENHFVAYVEQNPNKLFVQKHNQHRHIHIKPVHSIQFNSNESFVQEFIENPYLVDGYKFDIGVYVIITGIDPLRVYIYKGDVLFRFCPVKYYPFDPNNVDKYIVGDDYLPIWNVPSLAKYYQELNFGMKDSFDAYVRSQNQNAQLIWDQVEFQIRAIILEKEEQISKIYNRFKRKENFFELMRFDLIIDSNLKVYLMEANMSPNLSSAHFKPNTLMYEQILYNLMNLIGLGSPVSASVAKTKSPEVDAMVSDLKNIVTFPEECSKFPCNTSCEEDRCKVCRQCLSKDKLKILHAAYREHIHKGDTKRIFPVPITNYSNFNFEKETATLSTQNRFMSLWFYGKCKLDSTWCI